MGGYPHRNPLNVCNVRQYERKKDQIFLVGVLKIKTYACTEKLYDIFKIKNTLVKSATSRNRSFAILYLLLFISYIFFNNQRSVKSQQYMKIYEK